MAAIAMNNAIHIAEYKKGYFFVLIATDASDNDMKRLCDNITNKIEGAKSIVFLYNTPQNGDDDRTIIKIGRPKFPEKLIRLSVFRADPNDMKFHDLKIKGKIGKHVLKTIQDTFWFRLHKYLPEPKRIGLFEYDKGHYITLTNSDNLDEELSDILKCLNDYKSVTIVNEENSRTQGKMGNISDKLLACLDVELQTRVMVDEKSAEIMPQHLINSIIKIAQRAKLENQ
jgi:hypothetical protein